MGDLTGSEILAQCLKRENTEHLFFLMGGPMILTQQECARQGIQMVDVRHEQAAAMMAHAYSRLLQKPGVCMAASGPGVINLATGVANALVDCAPLVVIGGSSPISRLGRQEFQEIDQVELMRGCTKYAERVHDITRIPEHLNKAFQRAVTGKPGPVYLDLPGDVLYAKVDEGEIDWSPSGRPLMNTRPMGDPEKINILIKALAESQRPLIVSGSGVIWSRAWEEMQDLVERAGIPFYTTPQGRGVVPDDHRYSFPKMRSKAFREADVILILGTRMNYIIGHAAPPRFNAAATIARIDIDPDEIATASRKIDIGIVGDCKTTLRQLLDTMGEKIDPDRFSDWREALQNGEYNKTQSEDQQPSVDEIHPRQLCHEISQFMKRDAVLIVDGQEILNFGRQSINTFLPAHRLNSGPFGTMGVGLPFGVGAKIAKPKNQVIVLHGDGSFGMNAMELDTAVRHKIPLLIVISLNGGWTGDPNREKVGRNLGYTRFDQMAETLGCYGEYVERAEDIRPALDRAQTMVDKGMVAVVNVRTDYRAKASTATFALYTT